MISRLKIGLLAALAGVIVSSPAFAVLLTFSEFPVGTVITDQYAPEGVLFSGLTGLDPVIADDGAMPNSPVLSPNPPYAGDFQWTFPSGGIDVQFESGFWDDVGTAIVQVYGPDGTTLLDTLTNPVTGVYTFDLSGYGLIGRVTFNSANDPAGGDIDNLQFTVPEPASLMLLAGGLLAFGLIRRRKAI